MFDENWFTSSIRASRKRKRTRGKRSIGQRKHRAMDKLKEFLDAIEDDYESTRMLIDQVAHLPELWDSNCDLYHNGRRRKEAWMEVCHALNEGFDEKNFKEKAEICKKVMEKWKNITGCYAKFVPREKYLGQNISSGMLSIYAKSLSFLSLPQLITQAQSNISKVLAIDLDRENTNEPLKEPSDISRKMFKAGDIEPAIDSSKISPESEPLKKASDSTYISRKMFKAGDIEPALDSSKVSVENEPLKVLKNPSDSTYYKSRKRFKAGGIEPALDSSKIFAENELLKVLETSVTVSEIKTEPSNSSYHISREMFKAKDIKPALNSSKKSAPESDLDMDFLKSLHPLIKDFNHDQKLKFKRCILNVIKQITQTSN